jgi:glutamate carboxypeptidase
VSARAEGRAAHAGNFHRDGVNAVWALARFVDAAQALTDYERGVTVNVGVFHGGSSKNTVPDHAELELDFRMERAEDGPRLMRALGELAESIGKEMGASITLSGGVRRPPLVQTTASESLFERYALAARAEGLSAVLSPLLGGGSDANDVAALGVPVIDGLGPRGRGFHTRDEHIETDTLPRRAAALVRFLLAWND